MAGQSDFRDKKKKDSNRRRSIFFPLLILALGVFLLLNNLGYIPGDMPDILLRLWPLILIVGGLNGLFTGSGYVGSIVGIATGALLLMWNLGYLNLVGVDSWALLRLWPILLVAWGLDIVIGRRGFFSALVGITLGLGLIVGGLWLARNPQVISPPTDGQSISQPLEGARTASLDIDLGIANVNIGSGAGTGELLEGILYPRNIGEIKKKYSLQGNRGVYTLEGSGATFAWIPSPQDAWMLKLNPAIPLQLSMKIGAGKQNLDLTELQVDHLELDLGVGEINLTLPVEGNLRGSVHGAVGVTVIRVPASTPVRFEFDKAVTTLEYPEGYKLSGNILTSPTAQSGKAWIDLKIERPVGSILIQEIP